MGPRTMNEIVNVCLIGAGRAGMIHANNFKSRVPNAKIIAVVDPFEDACVKACEELEINRYYTDYHEMLRHAIRLKRLVSKRAKSSKSTVTIPIITRCSGTTTSTP